MESVDVLAAQLLALAGLASLGVATGILSSCVRNTGKVVAPFFPLSRRLLEIVAQSRVFMEEIYEFHSPKRTSRRKLKGSTH